MLSRDRLATFPRVESEAAVVREEDLSVVFEVVPHLRRLRERAEIVIDRLHLQHAALGVELEQ